MESRFRRFLSSRREKASRQPSVIDQDARSHLSGSSQWSLPTLHSRLKSKANRQYDVTPEFNDCSLHAVGYNTVVAGKAPVFTTESVKGNGPVKLQTIRQLSTGELQVSSQNDHQTLEDIREGDYIVAGKSRHSLRNQSVKTTTPQATPILTPGQSLSEASESPRTPPDTSVLGRASPSSETAGAFPYPSSRRVESGFGRLPLLSAAAAVAASQSHVNRGDENGIEHSPRLRFSRASTSTSPSIQIVDEQNATIAALWKAEYNRLVDMYGQEKIDGAAMGFGHGGGTMRLSARSPKDSAPGSEVVLGVLSPPNFNQSMSTVRRMSEASAVPSMCHDETSDTASTNRASLISSCAGSSSYTTQTNATEHDAVVTRDDIRKIVDQMRSNYLQAFQALEEPSPPPSKSSRSTKKKHRNKAGHPAKHTVKQSSNSADRQIWHNNRSDASDGRYRRKSNSRTMTHSVPGLGRLSPVEASPEKRQPRPTNRLQRADSATLGSIFAKLESDSRIDEHPEDFEADSAQASLNEIMPVGLKIIDSTVGIAEKARRTYRDSQPAIVAEPSARRSAGDFF